MNSITRTSMPQGGKYKQSGIGKEVNNTATINASEPKQWANVNSKTCNANAANQNTWFVIPSTYATNISWTSIRGYGTIVKTTPNIYENLSSYSGNYAMVVRNVAWDLNGQTPSTTTYFGRYYCSNQPNISNRSAGKLFLGSYSFDGNTETYNEGISFSSRPIQLTGYYIYSDNQSNETATVSIALLNNDIIIAKNTINLVAVSNYKDFVIDIPYNNTNLKATKLQIMITSSNYSSYNQSDETNNIVTTNYNNNSESCSRGAQLTIDNLTFTYD